MEGENPSVVKQWSKSGQTSANRVESGGGGVCGRCGWGARPTRRRAAAPPTGAGRRRSLLSPPRAPSSFSPPWLAAAVALSLLSLSLSPSLFPPPLSQELRPFSLLLYPSCSAPPLLLSPLPAAPPTGACRIPPLSVSPQLCSFSLLSPLLIVCLVRSGFA